MAKSIKITQVKSVIGRLENQKRTIKALGIKRNGTSVIHADTPAIRGMVGSVRHLVTVEEQ